MANRFEDRDRRWQDEEDWPDRQQYNDPQSSRGERTGRYSSQNRGDYGRGQYNQNRFSNRGQYSGSEFNRGDFSSREDYYNRSDYNPRSYDRGYGRGMNRDYQNRNYNRDYYEDYDRGSDFGDFGRGDYGRYESGQRYNRGGYGRGTGSQSQDYSRRYGQYGGRGGSMPGRPYSTGYSTGMDWNPDYQPYDEYTSDYDEDYGYEYDQPTYYTYEEWWVVPGPFSGVGPMGYTRSDERIREDISERLMQHGNINARNIDVEVHQGEVTLSGTVDDRHMKRLVEDTVESVFGVTEVHNDLRVAQQGRGRQWQQQSQQMGQRQSGGQMQGSQMQGGQGRTEIRQGMDVVDSNGSKIGQVKEVRDSDFLVDRPLARDIYVPFSACQAAHDQVVLNVSSDQIDQQNWQMAEKTQSSHSGS